MKEFIICAAIHFLDGKNHNHQPKNVTTGFVIAGRRHHNCYLTLSIIKDDETTMKLKNVQGFITSTDRFVDRKEAYEIAKREGQLFSGILHDDNPILISEELY